MAKAPTEEQSQLRRRARRRLVGSIALVTVIAVVLPWVLEHEPRSSEHEISIQIPSPESGQFEPKAPASSAAPAAPQTPPSEKDEAPAAEGQSSPTADDALRAEQAKLLAPAKDGAKEREKEKLAAEAKKKPVEKPAAGTEVKAHESKPAANDNKPYVVQVAALADADKAAEVQKSLAAKGLRVYTEKIKTAGGEVTRVRVGPFPNRDAAEKERGRMKALGFDGNVAPK
jgi:DedD protein